MKEGRIISINISSKKGTKKQPVNGPWEVIKECGLKDDAHCGPWHRQVSLLALESIEQMKKCGLKVCPGDFGENLTISGINLVSLPIGTKIYVGKEVLLQVSQIGKECHTRCAIYYQAGDCIMPREGIFAEVIKGGIVQVGDKIQIRKT
ncbi:MAG: MOSC domain-containing protein [bacterium]|nr:MOSC domain-containing protein [bacterium]